MKCTTSVLVASIAFLTWQGNVLALQGTAGSAPAAPAPVADPSLDASVARIAPWVEDATIGVLRVDLLRVDFRSLARGVVGLVASQPAATAPGADEFLALASDGEAIRAALVAAGATEAWFLVGMSDLDLAAERFAPLVVLPVADAAKRSAVLATLRERIGPSISAKEAGDAIIAWNIAGVEARLARAELPLKTPGRSDALRLALDDAKGAPIAAMLIPAEFVHRAFKDAAKVDIEVTARDPDAPGDIQTMSLQTLMSMATNVTSSTIGVRSDPELGMHTVVRTTSAESASQLADQFSGLLTAATRLGKATNLLPDPDRLVALLTPTREAASLRWTLPQSALREIATQLQPPVNMARDQADRNAGMVDVRQLVQACVIYSTNQEGSQWPPSLQVLVEQKIIDPTLLIVRFGPARGKPFVYLRPDPARVKSDATNVMVLYEPFDVWPADGVITAFADGSVRRLLQPFDFEEWSGIRLTPRQKGK